MSTSVLPISHVARRVTYTPARLRNIGACTIWLGEGDVQPGEGWPLEVGETFQADGPLWAVAPGRIELPGSTSATVQPEEWGAKVAILE